MATSSSSSSSSTVPILSQQSQVATSNDDKIRACQRLGELFDLSVNATEQACFEAAWEKCKERDWTSLKRCQEDLNHIVNEQGRSLLQQAIRVGEIALATEMIANGIAIQARDSMGNTPMHYAVQTESLHLVFKLYEHMNKDVRNNHEQTPLHYAVASGQLDIIRNLIENGANLDASTQEPINAVNVQANLSIGDLTLPNLTPLAFAAIRGDRDCVDLFLSENRKYPELNLNLRFGTIGNLVHLFITFHHSHLLEFVLKKYPDEISHLLNERNIRGLTPFMLAAYLGDERALVLLKDAPVEEKYKVNLEATDSLGRTAVHHAVLGRQRKSLSYLHSFGVNLMPLDRGEPRKIPLNLLEGCDDTESKSICGYLSNLCDHDAKTQHALPNFVIDPPENLVFKGDDPTGLAYLGVIKALEAKGKINGIKRVAGPSTGALIATLLALGYSSDEIASKAKILSDFIDCPLADQSISAIPKDSPEYATVATLHDIIQKRSPLGKDQFKTLHQLPSLCSGEVLLNWLKECIDKKTGIRDCTFGELKELAKANPRFKHLTVFTACFGSTLTPSKFSSEDIASDEIVIAHAVCAALSVPGIYPLKTLFSKNKAGGVDPSPSLGLHGNAAIINNFPIEVYDLEKYQSKVPLDAEAGEYFRLNKRTLGFSFAPTPFKSTLTDACTVHELLRESLTLCCQGDQPFQQMTSYNKFRIIQIENRVGGLLFNSAYEEQKNAVIIAGLSTTVDFFEKQEYLAASDSSFRFFHLRTNQGSRWTNLKPPLPYFVGRTSQIGFLKQRLIDETEATNSYSPSSNSSSSTSSIQRRSPCVVLTGSEGMGKSETAIEFAHQYRDKFSVVWWIEAATPQSIECSFRELADALHLSIDRTRPFEYIRREVYHFLESEPLENPYLLIFDNAEEAIGLPQGSKGRFIITTTESRHFSEKDSLPMDVFNPEEAVDLLQTILEQETNGEMSQLANEVECLPVILSQAAQHIRSNRMTLNAYLELLAEEKLTVFSMMLPDARYSKTQISAWRITHKRLEEREPIVYEWLEVCAHLQPDAIPFSYLDMWLKLFKNDLTDVERVLMRLLILKTLDRLGIFRLDHQRETYSLHRIRQEMIKSSHEPDKTQFLRRQVIRLLAAIGRSLNLEENGEWLTFAPHESHFRFILETIDAALEEVDQSLEDMNSTHIAFTHTFWNSTAEQLHPRIIMDRIDDKVDREYEDEAYIRNLLGRWCLIQGKFTEAETSLMSSLSIWRNNFSGDHIDLANTLHYIGNFFLTQQCLQKAEFYYLESYYMRRSLYGGDHTEIAASLHNLGTCCNPLSDFEKAESYFNQALDMLRRIYPDGHYLIALVLSNKGVYYRSAHRLDEAYTHTLEALHLLERLYPERDDRNYPFVGNQPIMAFVLGELGATLKRQGKDGDAVNYFNRAITIQKSIKQDCLNSSHFLAAMGAALLNTGNYHQARICILESLELYGRMNSGDIFLGAPLHNLGIIECNLNQMNQGMSYLRESLDYYRISIDKCLDHQDNIRVLKQAFRILSEIDNTQTKESAINYFRDLGNSLEAIGKNVEANLYFTEADRIEKSWTCSIL